MLRRLIAITKDVLQVLAHHDKLERQEIKTGLGIYKKDDATHLHIPRIRHGDDDAR